MKMKKQGFTIIELITVISIIVLIVGLLTPGVRKAKQVAERLKQRCQLRNIEIGLEQWYNEQDYDYPDSETEFGATYTTTGAHHLAEALIGRDAHGFDKNSTWNAENDESDSSIYEIGTATYNHREGQYVELDDNYHSQIAQIYDYSYTSPTFSQHPYPGDYDDQGGVTGCRETAVFTDVFTKKRIVTPDGISVKVGMPILYYKAQDTDTFDSSTPTTSIFNYEDNEKIMMLGNNLNDTTNHENHPFFSDSLGDLSSADQDAIDKFYDWLVNPKIRGYSTPYNKHTYILLSAGPDGLYGTTDDVHNISNK